MHGSTVLFRWDRSNYEDSYRSNAQAADKLFNLLEEIGKDNIDSVSVVAYASPEGVYEHNIMLSRRRAREFNTAVRARIGLENCPFPITVTSGGEAWEALRARVAADSTMSQEAKSRTLALLDNTSISNDTRKWRMMHNALGNTLKEGDVYHWLLVNHYVHLRCLDIKIYVRDEEAVTPETAGQAGSDVVVIPDSELESDATVIPDPELESDATVIPDPDRESHTPEVPDTQWKEPRRGTPIIGISTNLIYDATWIPNYGFTSVPSFSLEYYPAGGRWTFGADVDWSHWLHYDQHRFNQIHNITLHARRYFSTGEEGFHGLYLLGNINAVQYGLGWDAHGWEGEGLGLSAGIGHKWNWGSFFLDMGAAAGFFVGQVMKLSKGKADPKIVGGIVAKRLSEL